MALNAVPLALFRTWQYGYGGKKVRVVRAGTSGLIKVYSDPTLVTEADNPITLQAMEINGLSYGMYPQPLYVGEAYQLIIGNETSAVYRPSMGSLSGENLSEGLLMTRRGGYLRQAQDMADNLIFVEDYGPLTGAGLDGASPAQNTETILTAIGAASGQGGGACILPGGNFEFTSFAIPQNVILLGQGRGATVLQSGQGQDVVTLTGPGASMAELTLDGLNLFPGSVGVKMVGVDTSRLLSVEIKRFATGIYALGGRRNRWEDLWVTNCQKGADLQGNTNASSGGLGDEWTDNAWAGGMVRQCTGFGVSLSYEDARVSHNTIGGVRFEDNSGTALLVNGAQFTRLPECTWGNNVADMVVRDDDVVLPTNANKVVNLVFDGGMVEAGTLTFSGRCQDVRFDRVEFRDCDFTLTQPENAILLVDAIEDAAVTVAGDTIKLRRWRRGDRGEVFGITADATPITAWERSMLPGEVGYAVAEIVANQRNGTNFGVFHISCGARRFGSTLNYDHQTGDFTVGRTLTGGTSQATGLIVGDTDGGATGTLRLRSIVGEFIDNENISDGASGKAQANGVLVSVGVDIDSSTSLRPATTSFWRLNYDTQTVDFVVPGTVTGGTSGAVATIVADSDAGAAGFLTVTNLSGTFQDNEAITGSAGGAALVNGAIVTNVGYSAAFVQSGTELHLNVTGFAGHSVDWTCRVDYLGSV
jgi:hypothetical protein